MAKYLLLKHYRGGPEPMPNAAVPAEQWTAQEWTTHVEFMNHVAAAFLSSAPGPVGRPLQEWIEVRPFLASSGPSPSSRRVGRGRRRRAPVT